MRTRNHAAPSRSLWVVLSIVVPAVILSTVVGFHAADGDTTARLVSLAAAFIVFGGSLAIALVDHPGERVMLDKLAPYWSATTASLTFGFFLGAFFGAWP